MGALLRHKLHHTLVAANEVKCNCMFASAKHAIVMVRVKPDMPKQRANMIAESSQSERGGRVGSNISPTTSATPTARCGSACRVVWEGIDLVI
jgi:hypothetical protein